MKSTLNNIALLSVASLSLLASCSKDEDEKNATTPPPVNAQEQITTVILKGYDHDNPNDVSKQFSVKWEDLDGDGGVAPTIDSLVLDTGVEYHVHVLVLDKTKSPVDTVSNEILREANVHQFFYTPSASLSSIISIDRLDFDNNTPPLPLGMEFHLNTQTSAPVALPVIGKLGVVLSHYDGVPKVTTRSAESDIDIEIPVRLK